MFVMSEEAERSILISIYMLMKVTKMRININALLQIGLLHETIGTEPCSYGPVGCAAGVADSDQRRLRSISKQPKENDDNPHF